MKRSSASMPVYLGMVLALAILGGVTVFLPQGSFPLAPEQELPASKPFVALTTFGIMLFVYGGLGLLGLRFARILGFAEVWDPAVSNRQRFVVPGLAGLAVGILFIVADSIFSRFHQFGPFPHPPFPTSLVASVTAGIGEEVLFRLFFITLWVWLVAHVILRRRAVNLVFWIVATVSSVAFAISHVPALLMLLGLEDVGQLPFALLFEVLLLNGVLSILAAVYLRSYGLLAAAGLHFWTDVVWHVLWGARGAAA